ncbi:MAG: Gfo/Idh/MocA family oxidoreductase [Planctomycetes bacterium]|nr:Gfo/Idh/MocA family oxidoreductase [Planctomycetota bacterium]
MMDKGNLSRRGFLGRSLAGLTVGAGLPLWYAQEIVADAQDKDGKKKTPSPNDRITMAAIGTGTNHTRRGRGQRIHGERGVHIMQDAMRQQGVQMVAVCDVDRTSRDFAADIVGRDCRKFNDFRELLENRSIDAITIGTPDHWHALIAIAAMRAGKDVYCEKPLTLTHEEGVAMVRTSQQTRKIVQTGSQQRSDARFRLACELVRNGRIGRVRRIETIIGDNPAGTFRTAPVPEGLDWNFWLGRTARVDYVPQRCHYEFRWWYEYSGGKMTDWGAHHNDIAQWALGMDGSGPIAVQGRGDAPSREPNSYNCHRNFEATYTYGNGPNGGEGTRLVCRPNRSRDSIPENNGVMFEGDDNKWIFVSRSSIRASDQRLIDEPLGRDATRLEVSNNHMGNFISCIRSRRAPICNVGVGHRSVTVCHIGNIAIRLGNNQQLRWDPAAERFTNSEEANAMLRREWRAPWRLPA